MKRNLAALLAGIRKGQAPSFLLLYGDDYRVQAAGKALVDLLVPAENRSLNLERFDGRKAPWDEIESALMTPPLFAGSKTVIVDDAPYFFSREHKGDLAARLLQLWGDGKKAEAARLFFDLLLMEGWTQERWQRLVDSPSTTRLSDLLGAEDREVEELVAFCRGSGMTLSQAKEGEGHRLTELLEQGLPPWGVLIMNAAHVDRRTRLYKSFEEKGWALDLGVERERSGRMSREVLSEFLDRRLKEEGKKVEAEAREMILARAGDELWAVHHELEKLMLYVGEGPWIKAKDVEEIFLDRAGGWVFDLTRALAERDSIAALGLLARLMSHGDHPLKLLGTIAAEVRRLLAARQLMEGEMRGRWHRDMAYPQFQQSVLRNGPPLLTQNPFRDYMTFKNADNFTTAEILGALQRIYRTDLRLKSSGNPARITIEKLVLETCRKR